MAPMPQGGGGVGSYPVQQNVTGYQPVPQAGLPDGVLKHYLNRMKISKLQTFFTEIFAILSILGKNINLCKCLLKWCFVLFFLSSSVFFIIGISGGVDIFRIVNTSIKSGNPGPRLDIRPMPDTTPDIRVIYRRPTRRLAPRLLSRAGIRRSSLPTTQMRSSLYNAKFIRNSHQPFISFILQILLNSLLSMKTKKGEYIILCVENIFYLIIDIHSIA